MSPLLTATLLVQLSAASPTPAQVRKAKQLFQQGRVEYQAGQFQKAIDDFLAADKLKPSPALMYNVAQAYEKLGDPNHAVEYYQDYLVRAPQATDREAVKATIQNLQAKLQAAPAAAPMAPVAPVVVLASPVGAPVPSPTAEPTPASPAAPPPIIVEPAPGAAPGAPVAAVSEPDKPHRSRVLPITLGAAGLAAGILAIVGLVEVASYQSTRSSMVAGSYTGSYGDAVGQASSANSWVDLSIALGVVAVAGLTGAALTW